MDVLLAFRCAQPRQTPDSADGMQQILIAFSTAGRQQLEATTVVGCCVLGVLLTGDMGSSGLL